MTTPEPTNAPEIDFDNLPLFSGLVDETTPRVTPGQHMAAITHDLAQRQESETPADISDAPTVQRPRATPSGVPAFSPVSPATVPSNLAGDTVKVSRRATKGGELDWSMVNAFRAEVSNRLSTAIAADDSLDGEARLEVGRSQIVQVTRDHVDTLVRQGLEPWDENHTLRMQKAIYDSLFRLGRLQQHVDDPRVENVMVFGYDKVYVDYGGGQIEQREPIADSDQQLIEDIQFLASRDGERGRPFSASSWKLSLSLPSGERLQATHPPIAPRPTVIIRRHPLVTITLEDLVDRGTLTPAMNEFLSAAVRARKSIVVAGQQGAGKTTLLRALAHRIEPLEHIVTIETERELHLDRSGLHPLVTPLESRPGQGEPTADGSRPGEVTLEEMLVETLRMNTQRIIVGEVRGPEITAMLQAMQSGAGSMSTLHANSPADAVERMAVLLSQKLGAASDFGYAQIGQHIDFVVQLSNHLDGSRTLKRFISEISELVPGETKRPVVQKIFAAPKGSDVSQAVGRPQDDTLADLEHAGFDDKWLLPEGSLIP